jgi:methanogen homoisocitrate dehydrogenase
MKKNICVIEGDGIGKEVIPEALKVLKALNLDASYTFAKAGLQCFQETGTSIPDETIDLCKNSDAILFGAVTSPPNIPNYKSAIITLRKELDLFANLRPSFLLPDSIQRPITKKINLVIVRENTEDLYVGRERFENFGEIAIAERIITKKGCERIIRFAFEYAIQNQRKKVCLVHKANVLRLTDGMFLKIFLEQSKNYPNIISSDMLVDTSAMKLITHPEEFDVLVTSNMFGDILSDEVAALTGGLGIAASANIGIKNALFEPVHGSAPDIVGKNMANPLATFFALTLLLERLREVNLGKKLHNALKHCIEDKIFTPDLGGKYTTTEVTKAVISNFNS